MARRTGVPVVFTTGQDPRPDGLDSGRWADKNRRRAEDRTRALRAGYQTHVAKPVEPTELTAARLF